MRPQVATSHASLLAKSPFAGAGELDQPFHFLQLWKFLLNPYERV